MQPRTLVCFVRLVPLLGSLGLTYGQDPSSLTKSFQAKALPVLEEFCYDCHADGASKGGFSFDRSKSVAALIADDGLWKKVWENVYRRNMPPSNKPQPSNLEINALLGWVEEFVFEHDMQQVDPGRVTLRRLNRIEYQNTLSDLFGIPVDAETFLPPDDTGYGFDTNGDALTLSPLLMEKYLEFAEAVLDQAFGPAVYAFPRTEISASAIAGGVEYGDSRVMAHNGVFSATLPVAAPGKHSILIEASASRSGKEFAKMEVRVGKLLSQTFEVRTAPPKFHIFEISLPKVVSTDQRVEVRFSNDFYDPKNPDRSKRDRNLYLKKISLRHTPSISEDCLKRRLRIMGGEIDDDLSLEVVTSSLKKLLPRIYRMPLDASELSTHLRFFEKIRARGIGNFEAFREVLKAALVSPRFLFREELPRNPSEPSGVYLLNDYALASRLSYFLWSTMPDEELWELANSEKLLEQQEAQVHRMLRDPKSASFVRNFSGQWLQIQDLDLVSPDQERFTDFSFEMKKAMKLETENFFAYLLRENRPIGEFLTADYTFANKILADFYELEGDFGEGFEKVSLAPNFLQQRGGLLTHSSILTVTSNPTRTSPVKRGRWVLDNLLGAPPKDPPPDIPELEEGAGDRSARMTLRQQLAKHSQSASCASCHVNMDAMGFSLENFNAIGQWRTKENGLPIDTEGELGTGEKFSGPRELQQFIINEKSFAFARCLTEKILTYGIGRGMEYQDRSSVEKIAQEVIAKQLGLADLLVLVTKSKPFTHARTFLDQR